MTESNKIPVFVERSPAVIMAESKAMLEQLLGRELQPAQVEQLILQFVVYREVLLLERFNAGLSQMLYQFSKAPVLDYLAGLVAVERLPAAPAGCTVRFRLVEGHGYVVIPVGTRVATGDGKAIFSTLDDVAILPDNNVVEIDVQAEAAGQSGNGYAPGAVNKILDPLAFVSAVANINITGGGSDTETDEQLRARMKLAPSQFSTAGSKASYEYHAKSANSSITDISVTSPVPGTVLIVPLTASAGSANGSGEVAGQVIDDVYNACSPENVRPLTDHVVVAAPLHRDYDIRVDIVLYENADPVKVKNEVTAALTDYAKAKRERLGLDIIRSHVAQACRLEAVYDVVVVAPADNIVVEDVEFAHCTGLDVNIIDCSRG